MNNTAFNKNDEEFIIDGKIVPHFSGPSKNGGKIFKATPHIINTHNNMVTRSNIIIIMLLLVVLISGLAITFLTDNSSDNPLSYLGNLMIFFSSVIIVIILISIPYNIISFNHKMAKIYLEVNPDGIKGITTNAFNQYVYFSISYKSIKKIIYNSRQITIYTNDGKFFTYDVFYNPREIYSTIISMGGDKVDFQLKTL